MSCTHYAFSDDSAHQDGQYNSLAVVTLHKDSLANLSDDFINLLLDSGIEEEFKWEKLRNAKYKLCAEKIIEFVFKNSLYLRVDVVVWDLCDNRHANLLGRDDSENLVRMYYHLISSTFSKRWPVADTQWEWYPDEQSSTDWHILGDCLMSKKHKLVADLFRQNPTFQSVNLKKITPSDSNKTVLIQVADFFAGLAAFSYGHYDKYELWKIQNSRQISLLKHLDENFSPGENEKLFILDKFNNSIKGRKLQISLKNTRGLSSYKPDCFMNFWPYTPQHDRDKAPTKNT